MSPRPQVVPRPPELPQRDSLGEGPHWDVAAQALWWVDIVQARGFRLTPSTGEIRMWTLPSVCSGAMPSMQGDVIVALKDGVHRLDPASGATAPLLAPDPDPLNRSNDCRIDPRGRLWLGTMSDNIGPDRRTVPLRARPAVSSSSTARDGPRGCWTASASPTPWPSTRTAGA